jgi:hypothetical protein
MKSDRAANLEKLRAKASGPNPDDVRLDAIARAANDTTLGRPTRSYMAEQLQEIESKNTGDPTVISRILAIREKFSTNRAIKKRRLERRARAEAEKEPIALNAEPAQNPNEPASIDQSSASADPNNPVFPYPPVGILFPPSSELYTLGSVDMAGLAARLKQAGLQNVSPKPTSDELNQRIINTALNRTPYTAVTLEDTQKVYYALWFERRAEDPALDGSRFRFWPWVRVHEAVCFLALRRFGFESLKKAPPSPDFVRALLRKPKSELSVYERLEVLPDIEARAKLYSHLPGYPELILEFQSYKEKQQ